LGRIGLRIGENWRRGSLSGVGVVAGVVAGRVDLLGISQQVTHGDKVGESRGFYCVVNATLVNKVTHGDKVGESRGGEVAGWEVRD